MAAPDRWAERARRFADLYVDPGHGQLRPRAPHHHGARTTAATPGGKASSTATPTPGCRRKPTCTASRSTGPCPPAREQPPLDADPRLGARDARPDGRRRHRGQPRRGRTGPQRLDPVRRATATRDWIAEYVGAWRERAERQRRRPARTTSAPTASSAACWRAAGTAATTAGPGRTAGTAWAMRPASPRSPAPPSPATTPTSTWSAPSLDALIARGKMIASHRGRLQPPLQMDRPTGAGHPHPHLPRAVPPQRRRLVRLQPGHATPVPVALWHHTAATPTAPGWSACARPPASTGARSGLPRKEEAGHEEAWFAFLAGDDPRLPGEDPGRRPGPGPPPAVAA